MYILCLSVRLDCMYFVFKALVNKNVCNVSHFGVHSVSCKMLLIVLVFCACFYQQVTYKCYS